VALAPLKSLLHPDKNRKRIQGAERDAHGRFAARLRPKSSTACRRRRRRRRRRRSRAVVVVFQQRGWRALSVTQLHPSPGHRHPRDFTSRRARRRAPRRSRRASTPNERAKKNAGRREAEILMIIMIPAFKASRASLRGL
jgi:hypothetical protein